MKRILALLLLLATLTAFGQGFDGHVVFGTNLNAFGTDFGAYVPTPGSPSTGDMPDGGYYHANNGNTNAFLGLTLPDTLAAGVWRFQWKGGVYDNAELSANSWIVDLVVAGVTNTSDMSDRGVSGNWQDAAAQITLPYATNRIMFYMHTRTNAALQGYMTALYYTTNLNEDIARGSRDLIWGFFYQNNPTNRVTSTENVISASSFEGGLEGWFVQSNNRQYPLTAYRTNYAAFGNYSLVSQDASETMKSPYFYTEEDSRYYDFGISWKGGASTVHVMSPVTIATGFSNCVNQTINLPSSTSGWSRTNLTIALLDYPHRTPYQITIVAPVGACFDGISVVQGSNNAATFAVRTGWEVGWSNSVQNGVYYSGTAPIPHIIGYNTGGSTRSVNIKWEFNNQFYTNVLTGSSNVTVASNSYFDIGVTLPTNGWYRALAFGEGIEPQEAIITVMADPGSSQSDFIGTHNFGNVWQLQGIERLGISWNRASSPMAITRVDQIEATSNVFVWTTADNLLSNSIANNTKTMSLVGGSGESGYRSFQATNNILAGLVTSAWSNHIWNVVDHNKGSISYWECLNEPAFGNATNWMQYTNVLEITYRAARVADPTCTIVAGGGTANLDFLTNVINGFVAMHGAGSYLSNTWSIHGYPQGADAYSGGEPLNQVAAWQTVMAMYPGIKMWNTESGPVDWPLNLAHSRYIMVGGDIYEFGHNRPTLEGMENGTRALVESEIIFFGGTFERYFHYDSRSSMEPAVNSWASSWDIDDGHRPRIAGSAVLNSLVAGTTGSFLLTNANANIFYFENGNNSKAAVWTADGAYRVMDITNGIPFDYMMSPKTTMGISNGVLLCRFPTYFLPNGLTSLNFRAALTNATIFSQADVYPPGLTIYKFPGTTITDTNRLHIRWAGFDEYAIPTHLAPHDILFRSKLRGESFSAWSTSLERVWNNVSSNTSVTVEMKDLAGNVATQTRDFGAPPGTWNVSTINATTLVITGQ